MRKQNTSEQKKHKNTKNDVYDAFTYNFVDDSENRSISEVQKQDNMKNANKRKYKENNNKEINNKNQNITHNDNNKNVANESTSHNDTNKRMKYNEKIDENAKVSANQENSIKRTKNNVINTNNTTSLQNNTDCNETRANHNIDNNDTNDIVTIENRQNPNYTYYYSSGANDEIRINSMRNNSDIRITRQEYNNTDGSINRIREINSDSSVTGNVNLDSFFRLQFSFYYPNINREYLYDVYIENNDINVVSDTNSGINIVNETRHDFTELRNTRFTERLNESFNTLFSLFQNVIYKDKIKVLAKEDLKKIKQVKYVPKSEKEECSVCMEYYKKNENVRLLNCSHFFHSKCVDKWFLNESNQCPICRKEVLIDEKQ